MYKITFLTFAILLFNACGDSPATVDSDPRQNPTPRDAAYYKDNNAEADAQKEICEDIPSQARSQILRGNCIAVDAALRMRGFGDENANIYKPASLPSTSVQTSLPNITGGDPVVPEREPANDPND